MQSALSTIPAACALVGAGGHAAVLIDTIRLLYPDAELIALDRDPTLWGQTVLGVPIVGDDAKLHDLLKAGVAHFVIAVGTVGLGTLRARLFADAEALGLRPVSIVHPGAFVAPSASLAAGCQVMPGAVINSRAVIGSNALINCGAIVEHDCVVAESAHIATGARLGGGVTVGPRTLVGLGASVRQGIAIGSDCIVGAGAVVVKALPPCTTAIGVPARVAETGKLP